MKQELQIRSHEGPVGISFACTPSPPGLRCYSVSKLHTPTPQRHTWMETQQALISDRTEHLLIIWSTLDRGSYSKKIEDTELTHRES